MADEGEASNGVFRRSTMNRIASADELDHYIKVTNPSAWLVTLAALLLVAGVVVWAVIAVVPITVNTTGVMLEDSGEGGLSVVCWVDKATADRIEDAGLAAKVDDIEAKSAVLGETPMSAAEVTSYLGNDFYASAIDLEDWNYPVVIELADEPEHTDFTIETAEGEAHLVPVSLIVSESHPIQIALGKK